MEHIDVGVVVAADAATAFEWFTDSVLLTRWWPTEADLDVRPGGVLRMYWDGPDVTLRGEYRLVEPGAQLDHTWSWDHEDLPPRLVSISFEDADGGCRISVQHEFGDVDEGDGYRDGWEFFLGRLAAELDQA